MSGQPERIKVYLKQALKIKDAYTDIIPATVNSVSNNTCNVSPCDGSPDILNVRLSSEDDITNILPVPTIGSVVIVGMVDGTMGIVLMFGKIDSIQIRGTQYGGLVRVMDLTTKLNNLENKVNDLITNFNAHTHTGVTTGAGTSGTTATPVSGSLTPTVRNDIENTNIKHG